MIPTWAAIKGALKFAPWIIIAALIAALLMTRVTLASRTSDRDAWHAARDRIEIDYRAAQAAAELAARSVEARNAQITKDREHALQTEIAAVQGDARRVAADYAARLRVASRADQGGGGSSLPAAAGAASEPAGAGTEAVVDALAADVASCSAAVVKAEGWQAWWRAVQPAG